MLEEMHLGTLTKTSPEKTYVTYDEDQDIIDAVAKRYYGLDPATRTLYLIDDILEANQELADLKQVTHKTKTITKRVHVYTQPTQEDVQAYAQKTGQIIYSKEEVQEMRSYISELENTANSSLIQRQTDRIEYFQQEVHKYKTRWKEDQDLIDDLLNEIDDLEQRAPITQQTIQQEVYMKQEELPNGTLNIKLANTTLVFPTVQYLCTPDAKKKLSCMNIKTILEKTNSHQ
jgi:phage tail protein X